MDCLLGIDIGTSSTKSALFSLSGDCLDSEYHDYPLSYPAVGFVEQDSGDWWGAIVNTVNTLVTRNPGSHVIAMSLSTQGGCLIPLDSDFTPLAPAVSWMDTRGKEISNILLNAISEDELYNSGGWSNMCGLNLPIIVWLREKYPEMFRQARFFASTVDYISHRLTGKFVIDYSHLAMTMFLDIRGKKLSDKALRAAQISPEAMPDPIPSGQPIGTLTPDSARELGLSGDVLLVPMSMPRRQSI